MPEAAKKNIPEWFSSADKYKKHENGLYAIMFANHKGKHIAEKVLSWKSCPAILDAAISGYVLKTPVDIEIAKVDGVYKIINQEQCGFFCNIRGYETGFPTPPGYEELNFVWILNWMPIVPKGYTTLWTHPLNRFDLPFLSINGFIDAEVYNQRGRMPFFIKKDFEGVIPSGTPFTQIIPIKNEDWEMDIKTYTEKEIEENMSFEKKLYSPLEDDEEYIPGTFNRTNYKKRFWVKKQYD